MLISRKKFFAGYRATFGPLSVIQVNGLSQLLDFIEQDRFVTTIPVASYELATTKHETADTFHPIHEYGGKAYFIKRYGGQTKKGRELGNDTPEEGYYYAGQGYPQTTGESNFEKAEIALRRDYPEIIADFERRTGKVFDLTVGDQPNDEGDPANMMDPAIAYATMSYGMRTGMFTGHKNSEYATSNPPNYRGWRRVINGTDKAQLIAGYATKFEAILRDSLISATVAKPVSNASETSRNQGEDSQASPGDSASTQSPTSTAELPIAAPEPAVPVQTVSAEPAKDSVDDKLTKWSARFTMIPAAALTGVTGVWGWITNSNAHLVATVFIVFGVITVVYIALEKIFKYLTTKHEREIANAREQRAHETQIALIESAANRNTNTVALVPPPVIEQNSEAAATGA
jgi:putative chitinase